jgi:2-methylcitrate dehydratase
MPSRSTNGYLTLPATENQARGLARYAIEFCREDHLQPGALVYQRVELFHRDSVACAVSAIACGTNAPNVLRAEAFDYPHSAGVACFGSRRLVHPEKAIAANCAAVREWDANGTNFGYNPERGDTRGEFGSRARTRRAHSP